MAYTLRDPIKVERKAILPNDWNPNEMVDDEFNALCESVEELGMADVLQVVPLATLNEPDAGWPEGKEYMLIGGEHRLRSLETLAADPGTVGTDETDVWVVPLGEQDLDALKMATVRLNVVRGKLNPLKFTRLFDDVRKKYGAELTKQMMGFANEEAFERIYRGVRKALPPELQAELDDAKEDLATIDDLSTVLNTLFRKYGSSLDKSWMMFVHGGQVHWMIQVTSRVKGLLKVVLDESQAGPGRDVNDVFWEVIQAGIDVTGRLLSAPEETPELPEPAAVETVEDVEGVD